MKHTGIVTVDVRIEGKIGNNQRDNFPNILGLLSYDPMMETHMGKCTQN